MGRKLRGRSLLLLLVFFTPKKQVHVIHIRRNWSYLYGLCFGVKCLCFIYMLLFFSIFLSPSIHLLFHHWHKVVVVNIPVCLAGHLNFCWEQNYIPQQLTCGHWVASWLNYYQRNHCSMGRLNLINLTR